MIGRRLWRLVDRYAPLFLIVLSAAVVLGAGAVLLLDTLGKAARPGGP